MTKPAITPQQELLTRSPWHAYRQLVTGQTGPGYFFYYELCTTLFGNIPGLLGLGLRGLAYRPLFLSAAGMPAIGKSIVLRNPEVISVGKKVMVDDFAALDAHGEHSSIALGNYVSIGRFTSLVAKGAAIRIGDGVNIGSYCRIATQSAIEIGESTLVAAYCYIGPGNHQRGGDDTPLISREMEIKGGVRIGAHAWIGARATILDGVTIGERAIVGAHSLVREDVPPGAIVAGTPAKIIR